MQGVARRVSYVATRQTVDRLHVRARQKRLKVRKQETCAEAGPAPTVKITDSRGSLSHQRVGRGWIRARSGTTGLTDADWGNSCQMLS